MSKKNEKDWLFSMRFPTGETDSIEKKFIEKTDYVTNKAGFVRECAYGGFVLSELGILDLLVTEYRKGRFKDNALSKRLDRLRDMLWVESQPTQSKEAPVKENSALNDNWNNLGQ